MHFCVQKLRREWEAGELRVLHLSLNTPVVAVEDLSVGPARAGIALRRSPAGVHLQVAVRSLRTGQVVAYEPDEELASGRDELVAVDAALSFSEGMGFLFDEDEVAARGCDEAAALWADLVEELPVGPSASDVAPPPRRGAEEGPVLELVREVPVQGGESRGEAVVVEDGTAAEPSSPAGPVAATPDASAVRELVLSKFRLVLGAARAAELGQASRGPGGREGSAPVPVPEARIRLLSRF